MAGNCRGNITWRPWPAWKSWSFQIWQNISPLRSIWKLEWMETSTRHACKMLQTNQDNLQEPVVSGWTSIIPPIKCFVYSNVIYIYTLHNYTYIYICHGGFIPNWYIHQLGADQVNLFKAIEFCLKSAEVTFNWWQRQVWNNIKTTQHFKWDLR